MNRAELVDALSAETNLPKADCDRWLAAFMTNVEKNVKQKEGVKILGFGTFNVAKRKARIGRNPQTGKAIKIPARMVPVFRPGAQLKEYVRKTMK